jgi:hypothetical protein
MLTKLLLVTIVLGDKDYDNRFTYPRGVLPCLDENKLGHDQKHGSSAVRHASSCLPRRASQPTPAIAGRKSADMIRAANLSWTILTAHCTLRKADRTFQSPSGAPTSIEPEDVHDVSPLAGREA